MSKNFKAKSKFNKKDENAKKFDAKSTSSETALEEDLDGNVVDVDPNSEGDRRSKDSRDNVRGDSSTPYLKTTTEYGSDVGNAFYTGLQSSNKVSNWMGEIIKGRNSQRRFQDNNEIWAGLEGWTRVTLPFLPAPNHVFPHSPLFIFFPVPAFPCDETPLTFKI